ncbi:hypothetical protein [Moorena producens]|uniref:hypothetical protein n=1 Tax=Moorena producens TaxID=1155739 RepID=UPI003C72E618
MHLIFAVWVVRYGTDCPNTGYRENKGSPVLSRTLRNYSLLPTPYSLLPTPDSRLPTPDSIY